MIFTSSRYFSIKTEYKWLALVINLLIFRIAFPFLEYIFVPSVLLFFGYIFYLFIKEGTRIIAIQNFFKYFIFFVLISLAYLISLLFTEDFKMLVIRESITVLFFLFLVITLLLLIKTEEQYKTFQKEFLRQVLFIAVISAIMGLTKFILHLYGFDLHFLEKNGLYPAGTSLKMDHNFFTIISFFGIVLLLMQFKKEIHVKKKIIYQIFLFLFSVNIFFSFSRRGAFVLLVFISGLLLLCIVKRIKNLVIHRYIKHFVIPVPYLTLLLFFLVSVYIMLRLGPKIKLGIISSLKMNTWVVKHDLTNLAFEYSTIFNGKADINQIYRQLWALQYDSHDPASGWGTKMYKPVLNLSGPGSQKIPENTIGYKLDKTSNFSTWKDKVYSITIIGDSIIDSDEIVYSSVFCYVSEDFNGNMARLRAGGSSFGDLIDYYELKQKGKWQKLEIRPQNNNGKIPVSIDFAKNNASNFDSLQGYVIFAYPEYKKIKINNDPKDPASGWGTRNYKSVYNLVGPGSEKIPENTIGYKLDKTSNFSTWNGNVYSYTLFGNPVIGSDEKVYSSVYCYVSKKFNGDWVRLSAGGESYGAKSDYYDLNLKDTWQKLEIYPKCHEDNVPIYLYFGKNKATNFNSLQGYVIFAYPEYKVLHNLDTLLGQNSSCENYFNSNLSKQLEYMSVFNLQKNFFKKLLYVKMKTFLPQISDTLSGIMSTDKLVGGRIKRWKFAYEYYSTMYSNSEKLFGSGFDYLATYGQEFFDDPNHMDYPHNTILSAFLYSGIVGGIIYLVFLFYSFFYYFKYRKHHMLFLIFYLLTFFYVFFSSNSHFELPLFTFLSIIPFFTRYIVHKKQEKAISMDNLYTPIENK